MADDPNLHLESSVRRNLSETGLNEDQHGYEDHFDPYKTLERSQSDASLVKDNAEVRFSLSEGSQLQGRSGTHHASVLRHESHFVSESSKVYYDLSKAVGSGDEDSDSLMKTRRDNLALGSAAGVKFALETIPQNEELKIKSFHRSISNDSNDSSGSPGGSLENVGRTTKISTEERSFVTTSSGMKYAHGHPSKPEEIQKGKNNFKALLQSSSIVMKQKAKILAQKGLPAKDQQHAMFEIQGLVERAWATPTCGRDLAYSLCDMIRTEGALDVIILNCSLDCSSDNASENTDLLKTSAKLLEQIMTTGNRDWVVHIGLKEVVKMTVDWKRDVELSRATTGILESLFKHCETTSQNVLCLGGLDVILYWCRSTDCTTLRHCAISLANLAIFSGPECHHDMIKQRVPEWLFPLAFSTDDSVRYYACLAIATLVSNKEIESAVIHSGTMELVLPFIATHEPSKFAKFDSSHVHGRSKAWLKRLIPVLCSKREEAQTLAAFHFAMEAGIKAEQNSKTQIFHEIGAIEPLKKLASSPNTIASKLAAEALHIVGEQVPYKLKQHVPLWSEDDVAYWVSQVGFGGYADKFRECHVDGDLLLLITDTDLQDSVDMNKSILRKRFSRELRELKTTADYSSCDHTNLDEWLISVSPNFTQYTYQMLHSGVDRNNLPSLTDENLRDDCGIMNGIHRRKILGAIQSLSSPSPSAGVSCTDGPSVSKCIDVFISYRRSNGSQLASLLKVHLKLRGFSVFLDIERLRAGKFDEGLLTSVRMAKHFILVLTPNALDRCIGDSDRKDWVHKEIAAALESGCNIIPLYDDFQFPSTESLPEDIRSIGYFNGIRWIHDYQDACVDKLESFIRQGDDKTRDEKALVQRVKHLSTGDCTAHGGPARNSGSVSSIPSAEVFKTGS